MAKIEYDPRLDGISVIIPTCRNNQSLNKLLYSLNIQEWVVDHQIIVVDCSNEIFTNKTMDQGFDKINPEYIVQDGKGLNNARNIGLNEAIHKHILFLDDDVILPEFFFIKLFNLLRERPNIAVLGFLDLPFDNDTYICKCDRYISNFIRKNLFQPYLKPKGAGLYLNMGVINRRFDENRKYYDADETELLYFLHINGYSIDYVADPYIYHSCSDKTLKKNIKILFHTYKNLQEPFGRTYYDIFQISLFIGLLALLVILKQIGIFLILAVLLIIFSLAVFLSLEETRHLKYCFGMFFILVLRSLEKIVKYCIISVFCVYKVMKRLFRSVIAREKS